MFVNQTSKYGHYKHVLIGNMVCIMVVMIWGTFFGSLKSRQLPPIVVEAAACNGYSD